MGLLIDGVWHDQWYDTDSTGGRFERPPTRFHGVLGGSEHPAEAHRYHLFVSLACPWAHRVLIMRRLKGLTDAIPVTVVKPLMLENGWELPDDHAGPVPEARFLHQVYTAARPDYTGRVTVPALWDTKAGTLVNNESAELLRLLDAAFDGGGRPPGYYYPPDLRPAIDAWNARIHDTLNNGVYKAGFATTQAACDEAYAALFDTLDALEDHLAGRDWLAGERLTEADIRLFTTLIRFDPVYHGHFKCNRRKLAEYPALWAWTRRLYNLPEVRPTVDFDHIKTHYYGSHRSINPTGIIPRGPALVL